MRRVGRARAYEWRQCDPKAAEAVLLYLPGRKTNQTGYGTMLSRWRSGGSLCPVSTLAEYWEKACPSNAPLFPQVTRHAFRAFLRDEMAVQGIRGGGVRSPRRGGAAHLKVHLGDDARHKLCAAGGWAPSTQTAELYAGLTLEATKHWARLMARPVTLLQASRCHRGATSPWVREVSGLPDRHLLDMNLGRR